MSSRISTYSRDSRRTSVDSSEILYQELSIDDELFTARVYKRNYRNSLMQYHSKARQSKKTLGSSEIDYQTSSELPATLSRCVWAANVDYLSLTSASAGTTIEGPSRDCPNLAGKLPQMLNAYLDSESSYPYVPRYVEVCDSESLSRLLSLMEGSLDEWKQCMLYEACKQKKVILAGVLLAHGVWKDEYRPTGTAARLNQTTPMHVAAYSASVEIVELLIKETINLGLVHWEDDNGYQPLHIACRVGPLMLVALLVEAGAKVNCISAHTRDQPLHLATGFAAASPAALSYLLKTGANSKAQTDQGDTALHLACMKNSIEKVTLLLALPELLEMRNHKGWTPLHVACRYGSLGLIRQLLLAGSATSSKTVQGHTPLYVACTRGVRSVVTELLRWYHFPGEVDDWSESPLVVAVSGFNFPIVTSLLNESYSSDFSCKSTGKTILQQALSQPCFDAISAENRRDTIKTLLAFGANAGISDRIGNTALHHWAIINSCSTYHKPLEYDVSLEVSWYSSLLHLLLEHGARLGIRNHSGETPIDLVIKSRDLRKVRALQLVGVGGKIGTLGGQLGLTPTESVTESTYRMKYPDPDIESFTKWKAGSIPRHDPPDELYEG